MDVLFVVTSFLPELLVVTVIDVAFNSVVALTGADVGVTGTGVDFTVGVGVGVLLELVVAGFIVGLICGVTDGLMVVVGVGEIDGDGEGKLTFPKNGRVMLNGEDPWGGYIF